MAADQVTQRQTLHWALPLPDAGKGGCIPQDPTEEDECEQWHRSRRVLQNQRWLSQKGCSLGRPSAGLAWLWGQLLSTQTDSHPPPAMSAMHTAAAWLRYRGASAAAHGLPAIPAAAASRTPAIFCKLVFYGTASTGTLLWHPEHFTE